MSEFWDLVKNYRHSSSISQYSDTPIARFTIPAHESRPDNLNSALFWLPLFRRLNRWSLDPNPDGHPFQN